MLTVVVHTFTMKVETFYAVNQFVIQCKLIERIDYKSHNQGFVSAWKKVLWVSLRNRIHENNHS